MSSSPVTMASAATAGTDAEQPTRDPPEIRSKKRRAALACLRCRQRKVRCNIVQQSPCSNCHWDKSECCIPKTQRKRCKELLLQGRLAKMLKTTPVRGPPASTLRDLAPAVNRDKEVLAPETREEAAEAAVVPLSSDEPRDLPSLSMVRNDSVSVEAPAASPSSRDTPSESTRNPHGKEASLKKVASGAPPKPFSALGGTYLTSLTSPVLARVAIEDLLYLLLKGALDVPRGRASDALLDAYVRFVHPQLPVVDTEVLSEVLRVYQHEMDSPDAPGSESPTNAQGSLLLTQAAMFAAVGYLEDQQVRSMGFTSKKAARKCFFDKARLLYDLDCERDSFAAAQALLLMTFWHETLDDEKDGLHWVGVVLDSMASINPEAITESRRKLWRRIRWCCLVRDTLVSLGLRRPMRLDISTMGDPQTSLEDFGAVASHDTCQLFLAKIRLCLVIGQILNTQYVTENRKPSSAGVTLETTMLVYPRRTPDHEAIKVIDEKLSHWQSALLDCHRFRFSDHVVDQLVFQPECLVRQVTLQMEYELAISTLHRPSAQASPLASSTGQVDSQRSSHLRTLEAAENVSLMAYELNELGLGRLAPTSVLTTLLSSMMTLVIEWKKGTGGWTCYKVVSHLQQCHRLLQSLRGIYNAAEAVENLVRAALGSDAFVLQIPQVASSSSIPPGPPTAPPPGISVGGRSPEGFSDDGAPDVMDIDDLGKVHIADGPMTEDDAEGLVRYDAEFAQLELTEWAGLREAWSALSVL